MAALGGSGRPASPAFLVSTEPCLSGCFAYVLLTVFLEMLWPEQRMVVQVQHKPCTPMGPSLDGGRTAPSNTLPSSLLVHVLGVRVLGPGGLWGINAAAQVPKVRARGEDGQLVSVSATLQLCPRRGARVPPSDCVRAEFRIGWARLLFLLGCL